MEKLTGTVLAVFVIFATVLVAVLKYVLDTKGPKAKWRWGSRADDDPNEDY